MPLPPANLSKVISAGNFANMSLSLALKQPQQPASCRMFCFPYAGGRASFYTRWTGRLARIVEVVPVEYPGRSRKLQESLITSMSQLVESLLSELAPQMTQPFVFFGHSMGAFVAFEIAYELRRQ